MSQETPGEIIARVIATAWETDEYRRELHANPKEVLREAGLRVPDELEVRVFDDNGNTANLVIPVRPASVSEEPVADTPSAQFCTNLCPVHPLFCTNAG